MTQKHYKVQSLKPHWLRRRLSSELEIRNIYQLLRDSELHTVCEEAVCPNIFECFKKHTATFLILGKYCTRNCSFCAVEHGPPTMFDPDEGTRVALAVKKLGLQYVVVTSVTRDDLEDGGATGFVSTINALRREIENIRVEVLVPDFKGDFLALDMVLDAQPDMLNHNIETIARFYPVARPGANYQRSLKLLSHGANRYPNIPTKSGMMLGLGESETETIEVFSDLVSAGVKILTIGQYLQPSKNHLPVVRYLPPEEFENWRIEALNMGFKAVASGCFVRSSYQGKELYNNIVSGKI